jgi:hypothetical protein
VLVGMQIMGGIRHIDRRLGKDRQRLLGGRRVWRMGIVIGVRGMLKESFWVVDRLDRRFDRLGMYSSNEITKSFEQA